MNVNRRSERKRSFWDFDCLKNDDEFRNESIQGPAVRYPHILKKDQDNTVVSSDMKNRNISNRRKRKRMKICRQKIFTDKKSPPAETIVNDIKESKSTIVNDLLDLDYSSQQKESTHNSKKPRKKVVLESDLCMSVIKENLTVSQTNSGNLLDLEIEDGKDIVDSDVSIDVETIDDAIVANNPVAIRALKRSQCSDLPSSKLPKFNFSDGNKAPKENTEESATSIFLDSQKDLNMPVAIPDAFPVPYSINSQEEYETGLKNCSVDNTIKLKSLDYKDVVPRQQGICLDVVSVEQMHSINPTLQNPIRAIIPSYNSFNLEKQNNNFNSYCSTQRPPLAISHIASPKFTSTKRLEGTVSVQPTDEELNLEKNYSGNEYYTNSDGFIEDHYSRDFKYILSISTDIGVVKSANHEFYYSVRKWDALTFYYKVTPLRDEELRLFAFITGRLSLIDNLEFLKLHLGLIPQMSPPSPLASIA